MNFLRTIWREIGLVLLLLAAVFLLPYVTRFVDPTAGVLDPAWIQILTLNVLRVVLALVILWIVLVTGFKTLWHYLDDGVWKADFQQHLLPSQRVFLASTFVLVLFTLVFLGLVFG